MADNLMLEFGPTILRPSEIHGRDLLFYAL